MGLTTMAGGATGAGAVGPPFSARKRRTGSAPLSAGWMEKGRDGVGPKVAGVSRRRSNESWYFCRLGRPGHTVTPITGRAAFSL